MKLVRLSQVLMTVGKLFPREHTPKGATFESGLEPRKIVIGEYLTRQRNKREGQKKVVVLTYLGQGCGCGRG